MEYTRTDYECLLDRELQIQAKEYGRLADTQALVLKARGDIFVGRYVKTQPSGIVIFKVRVSDSMPRVNSFWTASYLVGNMGSFKNWEDHSWADICRSYRRTFSDAYCAWVGKADSSDFCLVGIKNLSTEFGHLLEKEKPIVVFGPPTPPLKYLMNLIAIVRDNQCELSKEILDYVEQDKIWNPQIISAQTDFTATLLKQMESSDNIIIQGPPGTGKTHRMAQLAAALLKAGKSVLVTALTNQALMELASKEDLKSFVANGKVSKTSLTMDEKKELRDLEPCKDNLCNAARGYLSLATFYLASGWAKDAQGIPFDIAIMDEASQALLPMIATMKKLGRKIIWIGDQNQLAPIVATNEDIIREKKWTAMVQGFSTLCRNFSYPSYMLSDSFRLTARGATFTGIFYDDRLRSVSNVQHIDTQLPVLHKQGGPSLYAMDLKVGSKTPTNALQAICQLAQQILSEHPGAKIAVLSKFRESIRTLQKELILNLPEKETHENIKVETVDRVQGLTVDYCIFFIPNASVQYSLENALFNVATSRARYCTIIIADKSIMGKPMSEQVRRYLLSTQAHKFAVLATADHSKINTGIVGLKVLGKIDLSKFEHKKTIKEKGGETYIIDTNVFVNCPDIISQIGTAHTIIVPSAVLEELDKLKLKNSLDPQLLRNAVKHINTAFTNKFSRMEDADIKLLPAGFDTKNTDCLILSVALKFKDQQPILLTSDNMLQTRASALGIKSMSLHHFSKTHNRATK